MPIVAVAIPEHTARDIERFWSKVDKNGPTAAHMITNCWLWTDAPQSGGYGLFWLKPRKVLAHRLSFKLAHGREPVALADHRCFVRNCVRPDHLVEATNQQNGVNRKKAGSGVYFNKQQGKWRAQISRHGGCKYLGSFATREEAERVAAAARL